MFSPTNSPSFHLISSCFLHFVLLSFQPLCSSSAPPHLFCCLPSCLFFSRPISFNSIFSPQRSSFHFFHLFFVSVRNVTFYVISSFLSISSQTQELALQQLFTPPYFPAPDIYSPAIPISSSFCLISPLFYFSHPISLSSIFSFNTNLSFLFPSCFF